MAAGARKSWLYHIYCQKKGMRDVCVQVLPSSRPVGFNLWVVTPLGVNIRYSVYHIFTL